MKRILALLSSLVLPIVLIVFMLARGGVALAAGPSSGTWHVVPSPNTGIGDNLFSVAALSQRDIWSVGQFYQIINNQSVPRTLTEHWNGRQWSVVSSPNVTPEENILYGVAGASSNDVWAVGFYWDSSFKEHTLTEHWNGTQWSAVASPNPGTYLNQLVSVTAIASNNVWAVGADDTGTLVEHWDGSTWSIVPGANPSDGFDAGLLGVTASATNDIWAVGSYLRSGNDPEIVTLVEHWNGSAWTILSSPNGGVTGSDNTLNSVTAVSSNDVWAVGVNQNRTQQHKYIYQTLTEHWDGKQWSVVKSPNPNIINSSLSGVVALASNNVWAVGRYVDKPANIERELLLHWNGTRWLPAVGPSVDSGITGYTGVSITRVPSTQQLWTVGTAQPNDQTFIATNS